MESSNKLGIDVGGTGIKGAIVDLNKGVLVTERFRIPTPRPANPKEVSKVIKRIVNHFEWSGPIGCGFPAAIRHGVAATAANIAKSWIGTPVDKLFEEETGCPFIVLNDADAAAMAEMNFGAGKGRKGVTIVITLGTGIGTAIFNNGVLLPNTELGHVHLPGHIEDAERFASDSARKRRDLSWPEWAQHLDAYLHYLNSLFFPDRFFIGGGASKKMHKFEDHLTVGIPVRPCELLNEAGIIGAAYAAKDL